MTVSHSQPEIVRRLRATSLDKDNFPRMKSEKWLPIGLALEAADRIEELTKALTGLVKAVNYRDACTVSQTSAPRMADASIRLIQAIEAATSAVPLER